VALVLHQHIQILQTADLAVALVVPTAAVVALHLVVCCGQVIRNNKMATPALRLFIAPQAPLVLVAALQMVCSADMEFMHQVGLPSKEDLGHLALAVEVPQVITMEALNLLEIPVMVREPMSSINFRAPQTITVFTAAAPQLEVILITLVADL
jgi:hypothetical protein